MKTVFSFVITVSLLSGVAFGAPDVSRFDGHYVLASEDLANASRRDVKCPPPRAARNEAGNWHFDARQKCEFLDWQDSAPDRCAHELYIKGKLMNVWDLAGNPENVSIIFYGSSAQDLNENFWAYPQLSDISKGGLRDENIHADDCGRLNLSFFQCFVEKKLFGQAPNLRRPGHFKWIYVSGENTVSNDTINYSGVENLISFEKRGNELFQTTHRYEALTDGLGKTVLNSEYKNICRYNKLTKVSP